MNRRFLFLATIFGLILFLTSCDKDDPVIPNEEELITTVKYTLTSDNGGTPIILSFVDLDGDGGEAPTIAGGALASNQTYTGTLELLDESGTPTENITEEIEEEDEDHQFFFQSDVNSVTIEYADQDSNGRPVGLKTTLTTGETATGSLTIILRHEPAKTAAGVSTGDITNAGGETDIEITFPIDVE